jgi:hypothetical protein
MLNGANAALVGSEIIQFQTVRVNADGTLTLSSLLRGRRGTEWATGSHGQGERFVMLTAGGVEDGSIPLTEVGQPRYWKLAPAGGIISQAPTVVNRYLGYDLMPWAPVQFSRAPSGSDLDVAWVRRTRMGGDLLARGAGPVPLSEESEAYEVYVLPNAGAFAGFNPGDATTYTRVFTGLSSPALTYTAAEMTSDGFTPAIDTLYLAGFQVSATIGRGFRASITLPPG